MIRMYKSTGSERVRRCINVSIIVTKGNIFNDLLYVSLEVKFLPKGVHSFRNKYALKS